MSIWVTQGKNCVPMNTGSGIRSLRGLIKQRAQFHHVSIDTIKLLTAEYRTKSDLNESADCMGIWEALLELADVSQQRYGDFSRSLSMKIVQIENHVELTTGVKTMKPYRDVEHFEQYYVCQQRIY